MKDESRDSYMWVLEKLSIFLANNPSPTAILTDRELRLMDPVKVIFPNSHHLLCLWHINRDVEHMVSKLCGNKMQGQIFMDSKWSKIINAPTVELFDEAIRRMKLSMRPFPRVIDYIDMTWMVHKEKFCRAWTNNYLHFGNTTTCIVESAHAQLKQWLNSSTGSLDTVWIRVNADIEAQVKAIRFSLSQSTRNTPVSYSGFPFTYLDQKVSHRCIELLGLERGRMLHLGINVFAECGCVFPRTHGIPCACEIRRCVDSQTPISLDKIHQFWKTLVFDPDNHAYGGVHFDPAVFEDRRNFNDLTLQVQGLPDSRIRQLNVVIKDTLNPDQASFNEPEINQTRRGRPTRSTSTKREKSSWEGTCSRGRPSTSKTSRGRASSSSVHNIETTGKDIDDCYWGGLVQPLILPYITGFLDVLSDGNCGFRVAADKITGTQENWSLIRKGIISEINAHRTVYEQVYTRSELDEVLIRMNWLRGGCTRRYWMTTPEDLYPLATYYNAAIFLFSQTTMGCSTILPLRSDGSELDYEIVICHVGDHYVRLDLRPGFHVPFIDIQWQYRCDKSVHHLSHLYTYMIQAWANLVRMSQ